MAPLALICHTLESQKRKQENKIDVRSLKVTLCLLSVHVKNGKRSSDRLRCFPPKSQQKQTTLLGVSWLIS